jgi:outer membrane protein assembly factor BamB
MKVPNPKTPVLRSTGSPGDFGTSTAEGGQTSKKLQIPNPKGLNRQQVLGLGAWDFFGTWGLVFGVLIGGRYTFRLCLTIAFVWASDARSQADDWPQWLGPQRDGVWRETGIIEKLPPGGPKVLWRAQVNAGYCGPAVAGGRVFLLDRTAGQMPERKPGDRSLPQIPGTERVLCLEAGTGAKLWEHTYDCPYRIDYPAGPRTTPIAAGGRVYTLGAMGDLLCLSASTGAVVWWRNFLKDFQLAEPPLWGWAAHPLLDGDRLICLVGGTNSAVVAFHKETGKEIWRALTAQEIGYAPPVIHTIGGRRQLIVWHPDAVTGLEPETGKVLWAVKYPVDARPKRPEVTIAMPRLEGRRLFLTEYYQGSLMLELDSDPPGAQVLWNRHGKPGVDFSAGLHTVMSTPVFKAGFIYGVCGGGELRCLDAATGERKWETYAATGNKPAPLANVFIVDEAGRYWLWTDQGELIVARLTPQGYQELSRAKLLGTVENTRGRDVLWCHPAFANRCIYLHNGQEFVCVSLAASSSGGRASNP